jgi:thiamine-phosphate pyrophosphorylase
MPIDCARSIGSDKLRVGVSAHSVFDVTRARADGADFCVLGPIFDSPGKGPPIGMSPLAEAAKKGIPVYALGGVSPSNARACLEAGAQGVAAIRAGAALAEALLEPMQGR